SFQVKITVKDSANNQTAQCSFTVNVKDVTAPVIAAVTDINVCNAAGQCSANIVVTPPAVSDNCSTGLMAARTRSDGLTLSAHDPVGTTTITWNATDAAGNAATPVVQRVIVRDCEKPVIAAVTDINVCNAAGQCSANVVVTPPAVTDNCSTGLV